MRLVRVASPKLVPSCTRTPAGRPLACFHNSVARLVATMVRPATLNTFPLSDDDDGEQELTPHKEKVRTGFAIQSPIHSPALAHLPPTYPPRPCSPVPCLASNLDSPVHTADRVGVYRAASEHVPHAPWCSHTQSALACASHARVSTLEAATPPFSEGNDVRAQPEEEDAGWVPAAVPTPKDEQAANAASPAAAAEHSPRLAAPVRPPPPSGTTPFKPHASLHGFAFAPPPSPRCSPSFTRTPLP
jgi:hypothetical protein